MGSIFDKAADVYRDFEVEGVPASGPNDPAKPDIRALFSLIDFGIAAAQAGITIVSTTADRDTFYATEANRGKLVYVNNNNGSATDAANGVYEYVGGAPRIAQSFYNGLAAVVQPLVTQATTASAMVNLAIDASLDTTRNLFDKTRRTLGFLNSDGSINANGGFFTSDYIPIQPSGQITANAPIVGSDSGYVVFYDAARVRVASAQNGSSDYAAGQTITAPSTASIRYVRVSAGTSSISPSALTVARGATALASYQAFGMIDRYAVAKAVQTILAPFGQRSIFDPAGIIDESLLNATDDTVAAAAGYYVTNYMPIFAGQSLIFPQAIPIGQPQYGIEWCDIDRVRIGSVNSPLSANTPYTAPAGTAYARCSVLKTDTPVSAFAAYVGTSIASTASAGPVVDASAAARYAETSLFAALARDTNLFDPARVTTAAYRNRRTGEIVSNPVAAFTHDMPLMPGQPVIFSINNPFSISDAGLAWLDAFGNIIGSIAPPLNAGTPYTPPANARAWFVNFPMDALPLPYFGVGSALPASYRGAGNADASLVKTWANKKWAMSGDSIVAQNLWAPTARDYMRVASYTNWGVSGSKMEDVLTGRSSANFTGLSVYGISSGTNNFGAQSPIGTASDAAGAATLWGAMLQNYNTILGWNPSLRFFMMTPLHRGDEFNLNGAGAPAISLRAYRDAIIEFGHRYGIPVYDQYSRSGIGPATFTTYMKQDDGFASLHPNATGGALIGRQIAPWIEALGSAAPL